MSEGEHGEPLGVAQGELLATLRRTSPGITAPVLRAFERVPRHAFVRSGERKEAYRDIALPIGFKQTISQPSMLALMLEALQVRPGHRVLEVGCGSGYAAALLAELGAEVYSMEIVPELVTSATERLAALGYERVHVVPGNGRRGLPRHAPYHRILVSAGAEAVPNVLLDELIPRGRIVIPVGDRDEQTLLVGEKSDGRIAWRESVACTFVPLVHHA